MKKTLSILGGIAASIASIFFLALYLSSSNSSPTTQTTVQTAPVVTQPTVTKKTVDSTTKKQPRPSVSTRTS